MGGERRGSGLPNNARLLCYTRPTFSRALPKWPKQPFPPILRPARTHHGQGPLEVLRGEPQGIVGGCVPHPAPAAACCEACPPTVQCQSLAQQRISTHATVAGSLEPARAGGEGGGRGAMVSGAGVGAGEGGGAEREEERPPHRVSSATRRSTASARCAFSRRSAASSACWLWSTPCRCATWGKQQQGQGQVHAKHPPGATRSACPRITSLPPSSTHLVPQRLVRALQRLEPLPPHRRVPPLGDEGRRGEVGEGGLQGEGICVGPQR